jgi:hypothetical protein
MLFALVAAVFVATGFATSVWISHAVFDDPFVYGRNYLWNATDVGSLSFSDSVHFFEPVLVEHYAHPGLTMMLCASAVIRACYSVARMVGYSGGYDVFAVEHSRFLFFLCSFVSTLFFLACTRPIYLITRRFIGPSRALVVASLFLCSVPVLLFINRFADEPYMLFFGLWSMELSVQALEGRPGLAVWTMMGACAALSFLAKPLMMPVFALNGVALVANSYRLRLRWLPAITNGIAYGIGVVLAGLPLAAKMPVRDFVARLMLEAGNRGARADWIAFLRTSHQAPFVAQNVVLLALAAAGACLAFRRLPERTTLAVVSGTLLLMMLMTARRPDWHYYFGFYWGLLFFAFAFVDAMVRRIIGARHKSLAIASFAMTILILTSWGYWGVLATYKQYHDRYQLRRETVRLHPYELPLIWEKSPGNSDLSEIFPVYSHRLEATLQRLRAESSKQQPVTGAAQPPRLEQSRP